MTAWMPILPSAEKNNSPVVRYPNKKTGERITLKAILVNPSDRSLSFGEVPNPSIRSDEVLVQTAYAAVNRADLMQSEGDYPPP